MIERLYRQQIELRWTGSAVNQERSANEQCSVHYSGES